MLPTAYDMKSIDHGEYNFAKFGYIPVPETSKNGGLYTGEEVHKGATYGAIPVKPDAFYMNNITLMSANPPPGAMQQAVDNTRPGNNRQFISNYKVYKGMFCQTQAKKSDISKLCAHNSFDHNFDETVRL
jgi:hypothetical protein